MKTFLAFLTLGLANAENFPYSEISLDPAPRFQSSTAEKCPKDKIYQIIAKPTSISSDDESLTIKISDAEVIRQQCLYQRCLGENITNGQSLTAYTDGITRKGMRDVTKAVTDISDLIRTEPEQKITVFGCAYSSQTLYLLGLETPTHAYVFYNTRNQLLVTMKPNH